MTELEGQVAVSHEGWPRMPGQLGTAVVLLGVWLAIILGTGAVKPTFLRGDTFTAISYTVVGLAPMAVGLAVVMIGGGKIDLSGGMVSSASAALSASLLSGGYGTGATVAAALGFGAAVGAVNGTLVGLLRLDPIMTTLGTSFVGIGIIELRSLHLTMPEESALRSFSFGQALGVTNLVWVALALLVATELFLQRTRPGRHVVALGGNPFAAERQGVSGARIRFVTFTFSGACAALGGVMIAGSSDVVYPEITMVRQFEVLAAVLLAGIALAGGRGRLLALLASILVVGSISTAIVTLGFASSWAIVIQGGVLGVALAIDGVRSRKRAAQ